MRIIQQWSDIFHDSKLILDISGVATQKLILSNDFAVIQWTILCYKNRMTTRVITSWGLPVTSLTTSTSAMCCLKEIMLILKMMKSHSRESYDK